MKRKIIVICAGLLFFLLLARQGMAEKTFPIGGFWPITGQQAYYGRVMSRGALTAIEQINNEGGVEGYKLNLIITDYKNVDANLAVTGVKKMISIDKIPVVLASFSAPTLATQPICARAKVLMLNGGAYSPKLVDKPYLMTTRMAQHQMIPPMLDYFWKKGYKKLAIIFLSDPAGEVPAKNTAKPMWEKLGGEVVAMEPHQPGLTDFSAYLSRIKSKNPDAILVISTGQDQAYIVKGARELGMDCPISVPDWTTDFQQIAGETSKNVFVCVEYFNRESTNELTKKFVEDFEKKWNEPSDFYSANYYDAVKFIIPELIRRVVKKGGNPLSGEELEKAIWNNPTFDSVYGKMVLKKDGTVTKELVICEIINGKLTVIQNVAAE
jgi:branched-chain amino acid transport system substrate-binding protein